MSDEKYMTLTNKNVSINSKKECNGLDQSRQVDLNKKNINFIL
jgi:hypothetical protein